MSNTFKFKRKPLSDEHKARIRESMNRLYADPERRDRWHSKLVETRLGRYNDAAAAAEALAVETQGADMVSGGLRRTETFSNERGEVDFVQTTAGLAITARLHYPRPQSKVVETTRLLGEALAFIAAGNPIFGAKNGG